MCLSIPLIPPNAYPSCCKTVTFPAPYPAVAGATLSASNSPLPVSGSAMPRAIANAPASDPSARCARRTWPMSSTHQVPLDGPKE